MRIRVLVKDDAVIFDFDGFSGRSCVDEFDRLMRILKNAGIDFKVLETRLKAGVGDASDLCERG